LSPPDLDTKRKDRDKALLEIKDEPKECEARSPSVYFADDLGEIGTSDFEANAPEEALEQIDQPSRRVGVIPEMGGGKFKVQRRLPIRAQVV